MFTLSAKMTDQSRHTGQGVALLAPCALTLSCAGLAAASSPSLQPKSAAAGDAGAPRPPPSSDSLRGVTLRWSALASFAAARSFAASLQWLPLAGTANVDVELPPAKKLTLPHALRLAACRGRLAFKPARGFHRVLDSENGAKGEAEALLSQPELQPPLPYARQFYSTMMAAPTMSIRLRAASKATR